MKYMGSKSRIAKYIVPIIQSYIDENNIDTYIEPFCGGCNVIDKIQCKNKFAIDNNKYLIELFKNVEKVKDLPEFVTKEHYSDVRDCYNKKSGKYEDWYIGAIGFLASYNGRFFDGGYAGLVKEGNKIRNMFDEAKRNLINQSENLVGIEFINSDYSNVDAQNTVIYCDIPYFSAKKYSTSKNFDYDRFYNWARKMSENNIIIVSEQCMPNDFKCIWEMPVKRTIKATEKINATEKLFVL